MSEYGELGSDTQHPHAVAPSNFMTVGIPAGEWCRCVECRRIEKCSVIFDFYASAPGEKLICEICKQELDNGSNANEIADQFLGR